MRLIYFVRPRFITDFRKTFTEVADAGIPDVVLAPVMGDMDLRTVEGAAEASRFLREVGLGSPACHGLLGDGNDLNEPTDQWHNMVRAHDELLGRMRDCGCRTYTVHAGRRREGYTEAGLWDRARQALDALVPRAESLGLVIALENAPPGYLGDESRELALIAAHYRSDALGLCLDSGHAHCAEGTLAALACMGPHIVTTHLHDNDGTADQHVIPGSGTIAWREFLPEMSRCGRLIHMETEAFNLEQWEHGALYQHYCRLLQPDASASSCRAQFSGGCR